LEVGSTCIFSSINNGQVESQYPTIAEKIGGGAVGELPNRKQAKKGMATLLSRLGFLL
jgi:hypothetical protein